MAVAFDAAASGSAKVTVLTYSHTVGAGSDRLILVSVLINAGDASIDTVTYAGVSLTNYLTHTAESKTISLWRLAAPATGANDVVITLGAQTDVVGGSTSWTGADQTPALTTAVANGNSATSSVDISSATDDFVTDTRSGQNTPTVGAGQTERWNLAQGGRLSAGSTETGAATVTMSWTHASSPWTIAATSIAAAAAGTQFNQAVTGTLTFTGARPVLEVGKVLDGVLNFVGGVGKELRRVLSATLSFTAEVGKGMFKAFTATLSFTGAHSASKIATIVFTAILSFTGSLTKRVPKLLTATLTFAGDVVSLPQKFFTAALTFGGAVAKFTSRALTATLTFTGLHSGAKIALIAFTAVLNFTGAVVKETQRGLTATLTFGGAVAKQARRALSGTLTFGGVLGGVKIAVIAFTAILNFSGAVVRIPNKVFGATLGFVGGFAASKLLFKILTATLNFSGTVGTFFVGEPVAKAKSAAVEWVRRARTLFFGR